jgi:hypothetical protein
MIYYRYLTFWVNTLSLLLLLRYGASSELLSLDDGAVYSLLRIKYVNRKQKTDGTWVYQGKLPLMSWALVH